MFTGPRRGAGRVVYRCRSTREAPLAQLWPQLAPWNHGQWQKPQHRDRGEGEVRGKQSGEGCDSGEVGAFSPRKETMKMSNEDVGGKEWTLVASPASAWGLIWALPADLFETRGWD